CGQPLARHVTNDNGETPLVQIENIVQVAAYDLGRPHSGVDHHIVLSEDLTRHEIELNLSRRLEVAFHIRSQPEDLGEHEEDQAREYDPGVDGPVGVECQARHGDFFRDPLRIPGTKPCAGQRAHHEHDAYQTDPRGVR